MRSEVQILASRTDDAKSRGPITAEGKKNSSLTALKHGLSARTEDHALFEKLQQTYIDSLQPISTLTPTQFTEARYERSHDRSLTRLRPLRSPNATAIQSASPGVSTTGRNPADYFFWSNDPKPESIANAQPASRQQLAAPPEFPPQSEPKQ